MIVLRLQLPPGTRIDSIISPKAVAWAEAQALNRTRNNAQTEGLKLVSRAMGISSTDLRKRKGGSASRGKGKFGAVAKGRNATRRRLETSVIGQGRPFNVTRWNGQAVRINNRVVATTHSAYGRRQIAKRTWMLGNGAIVTRSGASFRGVHGPGVGQMMERPKVVRAMQAKVAERFPSHFQSALTFALSPKAPKFLR